VAAKPKNIQIDYIAYTQHLALGLFRTQILLFDTFFAFAFPAGFWNRAI